VGNITPENAERIRQYVLDCNIRRLTTEETAEYLRQNGFPVNVRTVKRYRAKIRESAQNWIAKLAKSKRSDHIAEYRERIFEIQALQKRLWEIVNDDRTPSGNQLEGIGKLLDCSKQLVGLFDAMPLIAAIRDYGCGYDHKQPEQQQRYHPEDDLNTNSVV
jgi:hypothetical protein